MSGARPKFWNRIWPRSVGPAEPLAAALMDHYESGRPRRVQATRADGVCFEIETEEYFTLEGQLAKLDAQAMARCVGRVLDVGAGAGRHALALQSQGCEVVAIDLSPLCVALCEARGVRDARVFDVLDLGPDAPLGQFDTIFFGMQTLGVAGGVGTLVKMLARLRASLAPGGCIVADSSALREAWDGEVEDTSPSRGEIVLSTRYRGWRGEPFPWLYLSESDLRAVAEEAGFLTETLGSDSGGEFLVALRPEDSEPIG
ncbi:MAG: class I SAM-dependent methyltransferase [Myxococcota bacterium]